MNLEGLLEGTVRDVWVPLEKVNSGELRLLIEALKADDYEGSRVWFSTTHHDVSVFLLLKIYCPFYFSFPASPQGF